MYRENKYDFIRSINKYKYSVWKNNLLKAICQEGSGIKIN